jgi:release factor glutamine methyltransferase
MYKPNLDSFLLIDSIKNYIGYSALEIGTGSGIVSEFLSRYFTNVVATDIDFMSLLYCKTNTNSKITLICCDATTAISGKFDLIVSNPPYLPNDSFYDRTTHGGITGIEKTIHFIESGITNLKKSGYIILIVSSLSDILKLDNFICKKKLHKRIINKKELFSEILYVYELSLINKIEL